MLVRFIGILLKPNCSHVVMLTKIAPVTSNTAIVYHHIPIDVLDDDTQPTLLSALFSCVEFIAEVQELGGKVAVAWCVVCVSFACHSTERSSAETVVC